MDERLKARRQSPRLSGQHPLSAAVALVFLSFIYALRRMVFTSYGLYSVRN